MFSTLNSEAFLYAQSHRVNLSHTQVTLLLPFDFKSSGISLVSPGGFQEAASNPAC